ncbi:MAG TPA: hypothetical protein VEZ12_12870, partial [Herpetosiphonaceae bacterium]|nr:hypothetical protein [Herpetosiphonaceae bacterium]
TAALLIGIVLLVMATCRFRQWDRLRVEADGTIASRRMMEIVFTPLEWFHLRRWGRTDGSERRVWSFSSWRPHALPAPIADQVRSYVQRNGHQPLAHSAGLDEGSGARRLIHLSLHNGAGGRFFNAFWTMEDGVFLGCTLDGEPIDALSHTLPAGQGLQPDANRASDTLPSP